MLLWPNETRRNSDYCSIRGPPIAYIYWCLTTYHRPMLVVCLAFSCGVGGGTAVPMCQPLYFVYTLTISINFSPQKDCPTKVRMRTTSVPFPSERLLMKTHILRTSLCVHALIHRAKANTGKTNGIIILGKKPLFGVCRFNTHPHTTSSSRCFFRCPVQLQ